MTDQKMLPKRVRAKKKVRAKAPVPAGLATVSGGAPASDAQTLQQRYALRDELGQIVGLNRLRQMRIRNGAPYQQP